jgi:3-deoxy-manno-octulosonate cytidylyltransferase (CMP-KDO synthetase)
LTAKILIVYLKVNIYYNLKDENNMSASKQKVAMIIPMRLASTRLAEKQHAIIGDKPLIYHVLDHALKTNIRPIYIACDSKKHFDLIKAYPHNIEPIMTSTEHNSGSDRIFEATEILAKRGEHYDIIINLQGDMPFFDVEIIEKTLKLLKETECDIATCAIKSNDIELINANSAVKVVLSNTSKALYFSRATIPYNAREALIHIGIYIYKIAALKRFIALPVSKLEQLEKLEQLRALENDLSIGVCLVNATPISVDTLDCLEKARDYWQKHYV